MSAGGPHLPGASMVGHAKGPPSFPPPPAPPAGPPPEPAVPLVVGAPPEPPAFPVVAAPAAPVEVVGDPPEPEVDVVDPADWVPLLLSLLEQASNAATTAAHASSAVPRRGMSWKAFRDSTLAILARDDRCSFIGEKRILSHAARANAR